MALDKLIHNLPEVAGPIEKKLPFNTKLKWTLIILAAFFILANIPLYGLAKNSLDRFQYLAVILGTDFGSIISLGIGPIVMASIILQLLVGSKILNIDTKTEEGKKYFGGLQKLLVYFFIIFEACVYVFMNGLQAMPGYTFIVILQMVLGGLAIVFMDDLMNKWGFGHGVSLFIVAGVGWRLFAGLFQFTGVQGGNCLTHFSGTELIGCPGQVLSALQSVVNGDPTGALIALATILITIAVFLIVVYAQSLKVEIPLSFDRLRGYSIRWPLQFFYASVIPVILVAALAANLQLFGGLIQNWVGHATWFGSFSNGRAESGFAFWISGQHNLLQLALTGSLSWKYLLQGITHTLFYMLFSVIFAVFWVKTSGMDSSSQAKNIMSSGLQIPGFRKDERILESILDRYILPLTVMGGAAIGLLASFADLAGALSGGTSILLAVMIVYQYYNTIAQQHAVDMHPAMKKLMS